MPRRKHKKLPTFTVRKPPSDITFTPPDSILEPYPQKPFITTTNPNDASKKFKTYILNGVTWAVAQHNNGNPYARFPSEALCVNSLRLEVKNWREQGYPGTTATTQYLLRYWFENPREKILWFSQREAVETLIYLYEVRGITKVTKLIQEYGAFPLGGLAEYDKYPRYAFRMATGSGKTLVMSLLSLWSYFNYLKEDKERYTRFFLFVAPNIIVYDRLRQDLKHLSIFKKFQLVPEEWSKDFYSNIKVLTRDTFSETDRFPPQDNSDGIMFVTNIHQIGFKKSKRGKEGEDLISALTGPPQPGKDPYKVDSLKLWDVLSNYPNIMVLKDEAHHIHREESRWQNYLWELHNELSRQHSKGIFMELDFSATPKDENGALFPWIIVDFSLREALQTGIVKYPAKVILNNAPAIKKGAGIAEFRPYIDAALDRWKKHNKKLKELGKKSVLFIMADEISSAQEIYNELLKEPDIDESEIILIHSELDEIKDTSSQKAKRGGKELDKNKALELVRELDEPDNPIKIISSVMMLNEGWDVRSVTVILGLRSYASKREILPEQVIGRGLRKLFPDAGVDINNWINVLEVVGPPKLLEILDQLEQLEGIKLPEAPRKFFVSFIPRNDAPETMRFDIPKADLIVTARAQRLEQAIKELFDSLPQKVFLSSEIKGSRQKLHYEVISIYGKTLDEGYIKTILTASPIAKLAEELEKTIPLPNSFEILSQSIEHYITEQLFDQPIELTQEIIRFLLAKGWFDQIRKELITKASLIFNASLPLPNVEVLGKTRLEDLRGFPWSREYIDSEKSLFARIDYVDGQGAQIPSCPVDNELEADFVRFLDKAPDVISFVKNVIHIVGLGINYYDSASKRWRRFYPDFIVKTLNGFYVIETKGREEIQVPDKNTAAKKWSQAMSEATGQNWTYLYLKGEDWAGKKGLELATLAL